MRSRFRKLFLGFLLFSVSFLSMAAHPRIIKGTVYREGKPAAGVKVTAHKCKRSYFTSFDGKYELKADMDSKWIKFAFEDKEEKLEINANSGDIIDWGAPAKKGETKSTPQAKQDSDRKK